MPRPNSDAEYHEGPQARERFEGTLRRILKVSKEELTRREHAYQKSRAHRTKPGPKKSSR